ncbi:MAG: ferredoxin [Pseudomonadota bacterium]
MLFQRASDLVPYLEPRGLRVNGGFVEGAETIALISPGDDFWSVFSASEEYLDGQPDPMDRWSMHVIGDLAEALCAHAYFPFGPEQAPFFTWAQRSGQAWLSPVNLLVGAAMGLNVSYRGALGFDHPIDFDPTPQICAPCAAPCTTACPAGALTPGGYDVPACKAYLAAHPTGPCRTKGCAVRRACPASTPQLPAHAQFHIEAFLA